MIHWNASLQIKALEPKKSAVKWLKTQTNRGLYTRCRWGQLRNKLPGKRVQAQLWGPSEKQEDATSILVRKYNDKNTSKPSALTPPLLEEVFKSLLFSICGAVSASSLNERSSGNSGGCTFSVQSLSELGDDLDTFPKSINIVKLSKCCYVFNFESKTNGQTAEWHTLSQVQPSYQARVTTKSPPKGLQLAVPALKSFITPPLPSRPCSRFLDRRHEQF